MADFVKGLNVSRNDNAPDFIICKVGVRCNDFFEYMKANEKNGWLNFEIKLSKNGKYYAELDTWEPNQRDTPVHEMDDLDIPF
jgi:hypothetical protein